MKENQKEKNFNQELRKKIVSLFLLFIFKVFFVIISFNNTNFKILDKLFDYVTGIVFFRTIVFDLGKIYFKNIYANSKNLLFSSLKILSTLLVIFSLVLCFIFNISGIKYSSIILFLYFTLLVTFLFCHISLIIYRYKKIEPLHGLTIISFLLSFLFYLLFKFFKFKIFIIYSIIFLIPFIKKIFKIFRIHFSKKDRDFSVTFCTLITTTLITIFISYTYFFFFIAKCNNFMEIMEIGKSSFLLSGLFSIIKEFVDYLSEYAVDGNFDITLKNFLKKIKEFVLN
jgi:membrane protein